MKAGDAKGVERDVGRPGDLAGLAARCADWLTAERDRIEGELRAEFGRQPLPADHPPAAAAPLIQLLDRMAELPPAVGSVEGRAEGRDPVLDWVRRSVLAALAASGVTPVEDTGPVDPTRHNVVATRDDPSGLRRGAIAETVRPGYLWGEAVLRHQEVVAYIPPRKPGPATASPATAGERRTAELLGERPGFEPADEPSRAELTEEPWQSGLTEDPPASGPEDRPWPPAPEDEPWAAPRLQDKPRPPDSGEKPQAPDPEDEPWPPDPENEPWAAPRLQDKPRPPDSGEKPQAPDPEDEPWPPDPEDKPWAAPGAAAARLDPAGARGGRTGVPAPSEDQPWPPDPEEEPQPSTGKNRGVPRSSEEGGVSDDAAREGPRWGGGPAF